MPCCFNSIVETALVITLRRSDIWVKNVFQNNLITVELWLLSVLVMWTSSTISLPSLCLHNFYVNMHNFRMGMVFLKLQILATGGVGQHCVLWGGEAYRQQYLCFTLTWHLVSVNFISHHLMCWASGGATTAYPMSFTWTSHVAVCMLMGW